MHYLLTLILLFFLTLACGRAVQKDTRHASATIQASEDLLSVRLADAQIAAPIITQVAGEKAPIDVTWLNKSTQRVIFKFERKVGSDGDFVEIGTRGNIATDTTSVYRDWTAVEGTPYYYRVRALESATGQYSLYSDPAAIGSPTSESPTPVPPGEEAPVDAGPVDGGPVDGGPVDGGPVDEAPGDEGSTAPVSAASSCDLESHKRPVLVESTAELEAALKDAQPGDLIKLKDQVYTGAFLANVTGTAANPIVLCGSSLAILSGTGPASGRVLSLIGVSHWRVIGITVRNGQKGIMTEGSSNLLFDRVTVHDIGHEAVHFKLNSHHNTLQNSRIYNTGLVKPEWGEGLYFGTAVSNGANDRSDYNNAFNNIFGPGIAAEHIDAKEYSSFGRIEGNTFDGTGMKGKNSSESIIYIKGNDYIVRSNYLKKPFLKGIRVWDVLKDFSGYRNLIEQNIIEDAPSIGVSIETEAEKANIVKCSNSVVNGSQLSNVACVP